MENQHRHIKGYRDLTVVEINLMNQIKMEGITLDHLVVAIQNHLKQQATETRRLAGPEGNTDDGWENEMKRIQDAEPNRWAALARTHFQEGLMCLTRAVAQPTTF